jgi:hypothetical protein
MRSTFVLMILFAAANARADDVAYFEHVLGATDVNAAIGNGGATAGFSAQGELTVLRWPSPSYYEHVNFVTSTAVDARMQPHFGAADNQGSFAGVYVAPGPTGTPVFAWARETGWTATQTYSADDSNQLITTLHNATLKITVRYTDDVAPDLDVLVRHIEVTPDSGFTPTALALVYFENFSPTLEKIDFYPNDETNLLDARDYALGFSASLNALVHFSIANRPADRVATLGAARTPADVDAFFGALGAADGMYLALGGDRAPDQFQCGWDLPPAPAGAPADAYQNPIDGGGALAGSPAALTHADGALRWNLPPTGGAVDVFIAMGKSYGDATQALTTARMRGGNAIRTADVQYWKNWLAPAAMPATTDPDRLRLAERALLTIAVGRDRTSGAIVASIASQPPYNLDWPRDGSFIDYALDVAGYHDWVGAHRAFYASVQRQSDGDSSAGGDAFAGSFAMNFYADGHPGGPIALEIDEVGFTLWGWYSHANWLDEPARGDYLKSIYPNLKLGADLLTKCKDAATGLQCAENEDDSFDATITLHGAIPVRLGLESAVRTAHYLNKLDDARRWKARLDELDAAIEKHFGDPKLGYVGGDTTLGDVGAIGPVAWTIWPARFHPYNDPRMGLAAGQVVDNYSPFFNQTNMGGSYYGKGLVALALYSGPTANGGIGDMNAANKNNQWIDLMVKQVPTPTGHYGESFAWDGTKYTDVVCIPHLWEATLTYLALMAAYSPSQFSRGDLATTDVPPAGCSCEVGAHATRTTPLAPLGALALLTFLVWRAGCGRARAARRARARRHRNW